MKIVIISGSKRKGNSEHIATVLAEHLTAIEKDVDVSCIKLSEIDIQYCTGCLLCDETGKCYIEDQMTPLVDVIEKADGIIFISPVRWSLISGEMKTFLDRLNPLAVPMKLSGKKCITIVIGQSDEELGDSVKEASHSFKAFLDNADMLVCRQIEIYSCLQDVDAMEKVIDIERCKQASINLIDQIAK